MHGLELIKTILETTGLPKESLEAELQRVIKEHGFSAETLSLAQAREVLETYLHEVLPAAKAAGA
ncbi:MAG: hypothetical protein AB7F86_16090 [Bdellovibrionales bacterium]